MTILKKEWIISNFLITRNCTIIVSLDVQSPEIYNCLKSETDKKVEELGAGD